MVIELVIELFYPILDVLVMCLFEVSEDKE